MNSFTSKLLWVERFCYVNLFVGLIGVVAGAVLLGKNSDFNDFGYSYNLYKACYTLLILIGISFQVLGFVGIYAQRKKRNCGMGCYNITVLIFLIFTATCLVVMIVGQVRISDFKDDKNCTKEGILIDLKAMYNSGKKLLCSNDCPCEADQANFSSDIYSKFVIDKNDGANKLGQCEDFTKKIYIKFSVDYDSYNQYMKDLENILRAAETTFQCSGFCSTNNYYVFRNINDGKPDQGEDCKVEFTDFLSKTLSKALIITIVLVVYLLGISFLSARVIFDQERKNNGYYPEKQLQLPNQVINCNQINDNQYIGNNNNNNLGNNQLNVLYNNGNNFTNSNNTKNNTSINQMNPVYPQYNQDPFQQNLVFAPGLQQPPITQGYPILQEVKIVNQPDKNKYPQLQMENLQYINNIPPSFQQPEIVKQNVKY